MTMEELEQWLAKAKQVDGEREVDSNGNSDESRIYEHEGQLYRLHFQNGSPCEQWGEKGYIRGVYEPRKVIRETEMVEMVTYREFD